MGGRAWSFLVIQGRRQYAGNAGYDDDVGALYRFDSAVGNSGNVRAGDLVAVRDRTTLIGVGRVLDVIGQPGEKERFRCPACNTTAIKERPTMVPRYRCQRGHVFENPDREVAAVIKYEARYGADFMRLSGEISAATLRATALRPSTQNSIEEIDGAALATRVMAVRPDTAHLFERFFQRYEPPVNSLDVGDGAYRPSTDDRRRRILREISVRNGQAKFRSDLFRRYGEKCMVTGCTLMSVVDAAHIWPYRGDDDNDPANGLLLRSDVHVLFDLDLLGISPERLKIVIPPALMVSEYAAFNGRTLGIAGNRRPSPEALTLRWLVFCEKHDLPDQD